MSENDEYQVRATNAANFALWLRGRDQVTFTDGWTVEPVDDRVKVLTERLTGTLFHPDYYAEQMVIRWPTAGIAQLLMAASFMDLILGLDDDSHDTDVVGSGIACAIYHYLNL